MPLNFGTNVVNNVVFNGNRVNALRYGEPIVWTNPSEGLAFTLNSDNATYSVSGIGSCTDTDIVIPSTYSGKPVNAIANRAFYCDKTITSVIIPSTISTIGTYAFYYCEQLQAIVIGENLTTANSAAVAVGDYAFGVCKKLKSAILGCAVALSGDRIFSENSALADLILNPLVTITGEHVFYQCTSLQSISIPSVNTTIKASTFYGCSNLKSVTIPSTVTSIENYAFRDCTLLTSITLPSALTTLGDSVFSGCENITSITIPNNITQLGYSVFSGCKALKTVQLPNALTKLNNHCFSDCTALKSITLPSTLRSIGTQVFFRTSLTSITIPQDVTSIGNQAFYNDTLTTLTVNSANTTYKSVNNVLFTKDGTSLLFYPPKRAGTSYTLPAGVTTIAQYSMQDAPIKTFTLSDSKLTTIGRAALARSAITAINLSSVTSIEQEAFTGCTGLTTIDIPAGITTLNTSTFEDCTNLKTVTGCKNLNSIWYDVFRNCALTSFPFKPALVNLYDRAFYNCINLPISTSLYDTSLATIGRKVFGYDDGLTPSNRTSVALPPTINQIGAGAFKGISYASLPTGTWRVTYSNLQADSSYEALTVNGATGSDVQAAYLNNPDYYSDAFICKWTTNNSIILTADSEGDLVTVGVTGPDNLSAASTITVHFYTQTYAEAQDPTGTVGYTLRATQTATVSAGETVTLYFTNSPTYYLVRAVATLSGYSTKYLTEVNESYDPDATNTPEYTT